MSPASDLSAAVKIQMRADFNQYRLAYGGHSHASACTGAIDGIAASLQASRGAAYTAMVLYRAGDAMVSEIPVSAKDFVIVKATPYQRLVLLCRGYFWLAYVAAWVSGLLVGLGIVRLL